ncbi:MAG: SDR family oxidoreductase [Saprospiraceae bacterium]|nr:SDR family oxidoreductase [Saprospiraceae bacterium]
MDILNNHWLALPFLGSAAAIILRQDLPRTFDGKVVIITGSSQGIGRELAFQLAEKGARLVLNARNEAKLQAVKAELASSGAVVTTCAGDISKQADCERLINTALEQYGRIDVLINNAGVGIQYPMEQLQPDVLHTVVETNLLGSIYCTYYALPHLKKTKGSILFIGSIAGIHGIPSSNVYAATKMALTGLAESLRLETFASGVHIGIAQLGFTQNDPDKQHIGPDGNLVPCPKRDPSMVSPQDKVAKGVIEMIEKRQHKRVFSGLGKLLYYLNRISPELVNLILRSQIRRFGG